jgi:hypothetical protein
MFFTFILCCYICNAQEKDNNVFDNNLIIKGSKESVSVIIDSLVFNLPDKQIFIQNETHAVAIGSVMRFDLYKSLNRQKEVNYILKESPHSTQFGRNLYLKYGDVKILLDFDNLLDSPNVKAENFYKNTIDFYNYNKSLPKNKQITFIGLDFEMDNAFGLDPLRVGQYVKAIKYFRKYAEGVIPEYLLKIFDEILDNPDMPIEELRKQNELIRVYCDSNKETIKKIFGDIYFDLNLIINSSNKIPLGRRDGNIYDSFIRAYNFILTDQPNTSVKFFGSFGSSHVKPGKNGSFASKLDNSSQFKNQVSLIGQAYINCKSSYFNNKPSTIIKNSGLFCIGKKEEEEGTIELENISKNNNSPIILLGKFNNKRTTKNCFARYYDAVLIYTGL